MRRWVLAMVVLGVAASWALAQKAKAVSYPEGYRNWYHVKTLVLQPGHPLADAFGGIHHVYANEKAKKGLSTGKYQDGAVFVFDLLEAPVEGNALSEGTRKVLAVMEKDSKRFAETGGWGFQGFGGGDPQKPIVTNAKEQCFTCHESQKDKDYVFSTWRP